MDVRSYTGGLPWYKGYSAYGADAKLPSPSDDPATFENSSEGERTHVVQFYEDDAFLCKALTDFAGAGLDAGETVIVVADEAHRQALEQQLRARGLDVESTARAGTLTMLDARETLSAFMVDGMPSWDPFAARLHALLAKGRAGGRRVRIYGEMVDLLWREGNHRAAIRLEEMWNALQKTDPTHLLCGYSMDNFVNASDAGAFARVCDVHGQVRPAESHAPAPDAGAQARQVAQLQQRARALETEIRRRHDLEVELRQALEREQAANRARDEFLGMLGHELRNPLGPIVLALDLMAMELGTTAAREREVIEREVRLLVRLVDDLLEAARLAHGAIDLDKQSVEMAQIVAQAIENATPLIERKRHALKIAVPAAGLQVHGDRQRLARAVGHLVTNAAKYTPAGGTIRIAGERRDGHIVLRVEDHGAGIAAELLPRVFEPFVQDERGLDRAEGGMGIGLAIAKRVFALHGGSVSADSAGPGRGSVFTVSLPRAPGEA
jgi:signal transduction histidine kinase